MLGSLPASLSSGGAVPAGRAAQGHIPAESWCSGQLRCPPRTVAQWEWQGQGSVNCAWASWARRGWQDSAIQQPRIGLRGGGKLHQPRAEMEQGLWLVDISDLWLPRDHLQGFPGESREHLPWMSLKPDLGFPEGGFALNQEMQNYPRPQQHLRSWDYCRCLSGVCGKARKQDQVQSERVAREGMGMKHRQKGRLGRRPRDRFLVAAG